MLDNGVDFHDIRDYEGQIAHRVLVFATISCVFLDVLLQIVTSATDLQPDAQSQVANY